MTQDDIKRMAREQGLSEYMQGAVATFFQIGLEEGAESQRRACAALVEKMGMEGYGTLAIAVAIRSGGKA
jgi:hypothetical protein